MRTSGLNGIAAHVATALGILYRYENAAIGAFKQPKIRRPNPREILRYSRSRPSLTEAGHLVIGTYARAVSVIGSKPVAMVFAERVIAAYDQAELDSFFVPLGTGANLEEDSPILALRNRLQTEHYSKEHTLALVIKGWRLFKAGKKVGKSGLYLRDNEKFPLIENAATPEATE